MSCITHHYACDCREAKVKRLVTAAQDVLLNGLDDERWGALKDACVAFNPAEPSSLDDLDPGAAHEPDHLVEEREPVRRSWNSGSRPTAARNRNIVELRRAGRTLSNIAGATGISRERVRQILAREARESGEVPL